MGAPLLSYISSIESGFTDKICTKSAADMLTSWTQTFDKYNFEILTKQYQDLVIHAHEQSLVAALEIRKQIKILTAKIKINTTAQDI